VIVAKDESGLQQPDLDDLKDVIATLHAALLNFVEYPPSLLAFAILSSNHKQIHSGNK
jgi:hypothetical protein